LRRRLRIQLREPRLGQVGIESGRMGAKKHLPGALGPDPLDQFVIGLDVADRRFLRHDRRRHQRNIAAAKRAVDERLLAIVSRFHYLIADAAERQPYVEARNCQMLQQVGLKRIARRTGNSPTLRRLFLALANIGASLSR
jgi:hypothetical protein